MRVILLAMRGLGNQPHPFCVMAQQTGVNAIPRELCSDRWIGPLACLLRRDSRAEQHTH
jgi:hypothetical protein